MRQSATLHDAEICLAWAYKRLIVALCVEGWSGKIADQRVDQFVRYLGEPDERVFGSTSASDAIGVIRARSDRYTAQHHGVRKR